MDDGDSPTDDFTFATAAAGGAAAAKRAALPASVRCRQLLNV